MIDDISVKELRKHLTTVLKNNGDLRSLVALGYDYIDILRQIRYVLDHIDELYEHSSKADKVFIIDSNEKVDTIGKYDVFLP